MPNFIRQWSRRTDFFARSENKADFSVAIDIFTVLFKIYTVIIYVFKDSMLDDIFVKLMVVNIVTYIAFKPESIKEYLKKITYYYIINFIYVGVIIGITVFMKISIDNILNKTCIYIISALLTYVFNNYLWKMWVIDK